MKETGVLHAQVSCLALLSSPLARVLVPSFQDQPLCVGKARQYLVTAGIVRAALAVGWGPVKALLRALKHSRSTEAQVEWQNGRED